MNFVIFVSKFGTKIDIFNFSPIFIFLEYLKFSCHFIFQEFWQPKSASRDEAPMADNLNIFSPMLKNTKPFSALNFETNAQTD